MDDLVLCDRCGKATEWDFELGGEVVCVDCWDKDADRVVVWSRLYNQKNREKFRERKRLYKLEYYRKNHERLREIDLLYCLVNRDRVNAGARRRYAADHKRRLEVRRLYDSRNRSRRNERLRNKRAADKAEAVKSLSLLATG